MPDFSTFSLLPPPPASSEAEYDRDIRSLRASLRQTSPAKLTSEPLDAIDPARQSAVYLFVLLAHYQQLQAASKQQLPDAVQPGGNIWSRALRFLRVFDPVQVRYVGPEWVQLVELVAGAAESVSRPLVAVHPIRNALLRLDPSGATFTSTHATFLHLCLRARTYAAALPILQRSICHIPTPPDHRRSKKLHPLCRPQLASLDYITSASGLSGKLSYQLYLEYFLYGAMIFMGLKKWDDALHFLHVVLAAPANHSVSMIMVQAYKKWVLVCLLAKGTLTSLPRSTSPTSIKLYRALGKPYDALADVFKAGSFARFQAEVDAGKSIWRNDNNTGLVLQVMNAYQKLSILALERTFAALSVTDITSRMLAQSTDNKSLEQFLARLIADGDLDAQLVQSTDPLNPTVVRFNVRPTHRDVASEVKTWARLIAQNDRLRPLMERVCEADVKQELSPEYVNNLKRARRHKENGNGDGDMLALVAHDEADLEEDIMGGEH